MEKESSFKKVTAASLLVALGIIYGDIGTSPLYVLKAIVGDRTIDKALVYGGISCVFWTLVFQTTFKYIWLTLRADNHGEGGIFSLFALVRRYGNRLAVPTILGATTLLADGIITPPISVASAVEGLALVPALQHIVVPGNGLTIGLVVAILSVLFMAQRFGTQVIGRSFGPIMLCWFSMLFCLGAIQISQQPHILLALNPGYAYNLLLHYPKGFWLLGAVFLATTGAEALYSDLGHCGVKNIRISWAFVKLCLITSYFGQAAWLMQHEGTQLAGRNPFYEIVPEWFLIPSIILATAATIIASQALISGSFTLISEAMNLNFWPRVRIKQPTETKGQIYIPSVNYILWFGCVLMMLYFKESSHMEAAYGFSITITMMMTTLLLSYFLYYKLGWSRLSIILFLSVFGLIEGSFFIANVAKIKERWMFLFFELFIFAVMYVWYFARKINNRYTKFVELGKYSKLLNRLSTDPLLPHYATHLVYLTKANSRHQIEEKIINSIFAKKPKKADVYWFLHINRTHEPYTLSYNVDELLDDKVIKVNIDMGFRIQPRTELFFKKIVQDLIASNELNIQHKLSGTTAYNTEPDFKFVIMEKFLSVENEFSFKEEFLLSAFFFLKKLGLSDVLAFGIDKNDVLIEQIPLIYQPVQHFNLLKNEPRTI